MAKNQETNQMALEGRLTDGNAYMLTVEGEGTSRVCDRDGPEAVWARIEQAKKEGTSVLFSGARAEANGKLDGFAILPAAKIVGLRNWGPSALGSHGVEGRLAAIEAAVTEVAENVSEIEEELLEKKILEPEEDVPPGELDQENAAGAQAMAAAASSDDEEDED